jgi:hypothetical protein
VLTLSFKALSSLRKRMWCAGLVATAATLGATPSASAQTTVQVGVSGIGVLAGAGVQLPVTAIVPIQTCNNNVAAGLIGVVVGVSSGSACP